MQSYEHRLVVDGAFERTLETVIDAFLREGFSIRLAGAGDLRHRVAGDRLRFAVLEAWLAEQTPDGRRDERPNQRLDCEIALYELIGCCTLVTAELSGADDPGLASRAPGLDDRIGTVLGTLPNARPRIVAA